MISNQEFHDLVRDWLEQWFLRLDHEPRVQSDRVPDFTVYSPWEIYAIDIENDFASAHTATTQVLTHAEELETTLASDRRVEPVLIFPREVVEPEVEDLREHVRVVELPVAEHTDT